MISSAVRGLETTAFNLDLAARYLRAETHCAQVVTVSGA
jgi:hypothetical protein